MLSVPPLRRTNNEFQSNKINGNQQSQNNNEKDNNLHQQKIASSIKHMKKTIGSPSQNNRKHTEHELKREKSEGKLPNLTSMASLNEINVIQYISSKEAAKIKIIHNDYTHHNNHVINRTISGLNQFINATFRNKENYLDHKTIHKLANVFGLHLPTGKNAISVQGYKNKEIANPLKEKLLKTLSYIINVENELPLLQASQKQIQYRFYIGTANNGVMVRSILKQRWWWTYGKKNDENLNLLWTQWSKKTFLQALPSKKSGSAMPFPVSGSTKSMTDLLKEERKSDASNNVNVSSESDGDTTISKQHANTPKAKNTKYSAMQAIQNVQGQSNTICENKAPTNIKMCNHLEFHYHLSNKKAMFFNMNQYYLAMKKDPFDTLPLTFHIRNGLEDPEFTKFASYYQNIESKIIQQQQQLSSQNTLKSADLKDTLENTKSTLSISNQTIEKNIWIIKPGENTNRGNGIQVLREFEEIKKAITGNGPLLTAAPNESKGKPPPRTYIVQKYIERPLLINKRKFDIRMFGLISSINGFLKGYFYEEGYLRTSSKEYTLKNLQKKSIHLTNDAVQSKTDDYGKYETGNKLSFPDFQKYLDQTYPSLHIDFTRDILSQIKVFFYKFYF